MLRATDTLIHVSHGTQIVPVSQSKSVWVSFDAWGDGRSLGTEVTHGLLEEEYS